MSRFLVSPQLFPARIAGEPWGAERVTIDIPGGPFAISGLSDTQSASLRDRFTKPSGNVAGYEIAVFRASRNDFLPIDTRAWNYELELDGQTIAGLDVMARVGNDRGAIWTPVTARDAFWGIVENVLRPLVARRLLAANGLLLHSSSAVVKGRAFLFCGISGAGKSTVGRLAVASGREVFSDDLNAIAGDDVLPLPFTGDLEPSAIRSSAAPLEAIVELEKGDREEIRPMSRARAMSVIVRCSPYVNRDLLVADALLDRAAAVASRVRAATLTFRRDGDVWPILESW